MPELPSHLYHSGEIDSALSSFLNERNSSSDQQTLSANNSTSEQLDSVRSLERENPEMADLFNRIRSRPGFAGWDTLSFRSTEGTMELRRELRAAGPAASRYIFDHINNDPSLAPGAERSGHRIYCYCSLLEYCTTPEDEPELTKLLLDPRFANDADRSNRTILMGILQRVGSISSCDALNEFAYQQSQNLGYNVSTLRLDLNAVQYTLGYIYARGNEDDRIAIRRAQRDIAELARDNGMEAEPVVLSRSNVDSDQENYEYLFRDHFNHGLTSFNNGSTYGSRSSEYEESYDRDDEETEDTPEREGDEDEEIENEVEQRLGYEINDRLDVLRNLHKIPNTEVVIPGLVETDPEKLAQKHKLELKEIHPSRYSPTLGIEIEIRDKVVLPPEAKNWDDFHKSEYKVDLRSRKYEPTRRAGIPTGYDAFWEFAHSPAHNPLTLSREVQWLIRHGLIPPERGRHSLHLTIGGITSAENAGDHDHENFARNPSQAYLLGRALEATGWCTTGGRILRPVLTDSGAWTYKGNSGVNERYRSEIELNQSKAVEYRIFQLQTLSGLNRMLGSAHSLGAALKAYQECELFDKKERFIGPPDDNQRKLAEIWQDFADQIKQLFEDYTLANPEKVWPEPLTKSSNPYLEALDGKGGFNLLATLLDESAKEPNSDGAEFVTEVRKLVIQTRAKVEPILYPPTSNSSPAQLEAIPNQLAAD